MASPLKSDFQKDILWILGTLMGVTLGGVLGPANLHAQEAMGGVSAMLATPYGADQNPANAPFVPKTQVEAEGHMIYGTTTADRPDVETYKSKKFFLGFPHYPMVHIKLRDNFAIGGFPVLVPFELTSSQSGIPGTVKGTPTSYDIKTSIKSLLGFRGYWGWAPQPLFAIGGGMSLASGQVNHSLEDSQGKATEISVGKANILKFKGGVRLNLFGDGFSIGGSAVLAQITQLQGVAVDGPAGSLRDDQVADLTPKATNLLPSVLGGFRFNLGLISGYGDTEIFRATENQNIYSLRDQDVRESSFQNRFVIRGGGKIQVFSPFGLIGGFAYDTGDMGPGESSGKAGYAATQVVASDFAQGGSILASAAQPLINDGGLDETFSPFGLGAHLPTFRIGGGGELRFFPRKLSAPAPLQRTKERRTYYRLVLRGEGYFQSVSVDTGADNYEPVTIKKSQLVFPGSIIYSF